MRPPQIFKIKIGEHSNTGDSSNTFCVNNKINGRHPNSYKVAEIIVDYNAWITHGVSYVQIFAFVEDKSRSTAQNPVFRPEKILWREFFGQKLDITYPFEESLQHHEHTVREILDRR